MKPGQGISQRERQLEAKLREIEQKRLKEMGIKYPKEAPAPLTGKTAKESLRGPELEREKIARLQKQIKNLADLKNEALKVPTTELLETLFAGAISTAASDVHFEPEEKEIRLRFRIDGHLGDVLNLKKEDYPAILSRIKLMAGLKINIHEAPQDGRFTIRQTGQSDIEVRVSILPGAYQENIALRLLDPQIIKKNLEDLGMREDLLQEIKKQLKKTTGSILTTGPTGSGKTTTLYAFIDFISEPGIKIITIEDPIEYHIKGISQTQVDPSKGYDFVNGLRSIVRQDPDVILVGEIRDAETAQITMNAALTGHLVFSTLHTNDAAGTIPRLIDMGIKTQILAPAINLAMAQRLVRRLCPGCKEKAKLTDQEIQAIKRVLGNLTGKTEWTTYKTKGCRECNNIGYKGRVGIFEAFTIDEELEKLILGSPAINEIRNFLIRRGMITLRQDAFLKIIEGITDLEEVGRVLGE